MHKYLILITYIFLFSFALSDKISVLNQRLLTLEQKIKNEESQFSEIFRNLLAEREKIIENLNDKNLQKDNIELEKLNDKLANNINKFKLERENKERIFSSYDNERKNIQNLISNFSAKKIRSASSFGDPHYTGFYGDRFSFQPVGDAIVVISEKFSFKIECRHKIWNNSNITIMVACVFKLGENYVEFNGEKLELFVNKKLQNIDKIIETGLIKIKKISNYQYEFSSDGIIFNFSCSNNPCICNFSLTLSEEIIDELGNSILNNLKNGIPPTFKRPEESLFYYELQKHMEDITNKNPHPIRELTEEEKNMIKELRKNSSVNEIDISNIEFDLRNSPLDIGKRILDINIVSINENNKNIIENENILTMISKQKNENFFGLFSLSIALILSSYLLLKYIKK